MEGAWELFNELVDQLMRQFRSKFSCAFFIGMIQQVLSIVNCVICFVFFPMTHIEFFIYILSFISMPATL
jgi:hypothetical protein